MADTLFRRSYYWDRLRANPLGEIIEEYVQHFRGLGYSWLTVRGYVQSLEHFGGWLRSRRLGPKAVNGSWSGLSSVITFPSAVVLIPHPSL